MITFFKCKVYFLCSELYIYFHTIINFTLVYFYYFQVPNGFSPNADISKENFDLQNDSNNNFKLAYTPLPPPQLPPEPALNLIYRENLPSPNYPEHFERLSYNNEIKTIPKLPDSSEYSYPPQHELVYASESNSSSCLSDVRGEEDLKKSEEEKEEEKQKPYKCEECGKQFSQLRNYKYHR